MSTNNTPNEKHASRSRFIVLERAYELIREVRGLHQKVRARDADEARQLKRAASGIVRNLGEGRRRRGQDRVHLWRVAAGSADEVQQSLRASEAWGYVTEREIANAVAKTDEILAMLWKLTEG